MRNIGDRIKQCRIDRGLTQVELSRGSGIGQSYLSQIEQGKKIPALDTLQAIARAIGVSVAFLADDNDDAIPCGLSTEAGSAMTITSPLDIQRYEEWLHGHISDAMLVEGRDLRYIEAAAENILEMVRHEKTARFGELNEFGERLA